MKNYRNSRLKITFDSFTRIITHNTKNINTKKKVYTSEIEECESERMLLGRNL